MLNKLKLTAWNRLKKAASNNVKKLPNNGEAPPYTVMLFSIQNIPNAQRPKPKKYEIKKVFLMLSLLINWYRSPGIRKAKAQRLKGWKAKIIREPKKNPAKNL